MRTARRVVSLWMYGGHMQFRLAGVELDGTWGAMSIRIYAWPRAIA